MFIIAATIGLLVAVSIRTPSGGLDHTLRTFLTLRRTDSDSTAIAKKTEEKKSATESASVEATPSGTILPTIIVGNVTDTPIKTPTKKPTKTPSKKTTPSPTLPPKKSPTSSSSTNPSPSLQAQTPQSVPPTGAGGSIQYRIGCGETLMQISLNFYGTTQRVGDIVNANRYTITDPDNLTCGDDIRIP